MKQTTRDTLGTLAALALIIGAVLAPITAVGHEATTLPTVQPEADAPWSQDDYQYCLDNTRATEEECERWAIKTATEDARERAMETE